MFCKFCGAQISDNAVFCEKCGKRLTEENMSIHEMFSSSTNRSNYSFNNIDKGEYVTSAKFNPAGMVVGLVFSIILFFSGIATMGWASSLNWYDRMYSDREMIQTLGTIMLVGGIIAAICDLITISVNSKIQCTVYENMVIGTGTHSRWDMNGTDFQLTYAEIENVSADNRIISIYTYNGTKYFVSASDADEADTMVQAINSRIKTGYRKTLPQSQNNTYANLEIPKASWICPNCRQINYPLVTKCTVCGEPMHNKSEIKKFSTIQAGANEWKCPNCGRSNQNYVGMCKCGTPILNKQNVSK